MRASTEAERKERDALTLVEGLRADVEALRAQVLDARALAVPAVSEPIDRRAARCVACNGTQSASCEARGETPPLARPGNSRSPAFPSRASWPLLR